MKLFNDNWTFLKTPLGTEAEDIRGREAEFLPVDIPHDWMIYDTLNLYEDSIGWYRKVVTADALGIKDGETAYLRFDGVYMDSTVYVNGVALGNWKYGYSAFGYDITQELGEGENEILVKVVYRSPNTRWYSGAGIYRNVWLKIYPQTYLPLDGTYVHNTFLSEGKYQMEVDTEVEGLIDETTQVKYTLLYHGEEAASLGVHHPISKKVSCAAELDKLKEWDIEAPECYVLRVELLQGGECMDVQELTVGFKRMHFDTEKGFFLNGRHVKIHGVCEHHDHGALGAAFHEEAMRRKFTILREMGVNALRTAHNMPAKELMDIADEMGFLILSEAFDMWERPKTEYDYGNYFKESAGADVRSWIRRDRNHPSLFMWSIGNEIYDTHADPWAPDIVRRLVDAVREADRKENALITIGSNYMPWEGAQKCADIVKVAGYNYAERLYEEHHAAHPDWIIFGSETSSTVQSRGVYRFPLSQSILSDEDEQCSCLGNCCTSWGAKNTESCIIPDRDAEFCFGQFIWTGFDYIGEPTPYQTKNSYFGQIDTAGIPKDTFYIYRSEWGEGKLTPMVHVYPHWDFSEGEELDVRATTDAASVELFVNGTSRGRQELDHEGGSVLQGLWHVTYEPGEIVAVAYDKAGKEVARHARHSFGDGVRLLLQANKTCLKANGEDLAYITISTEDKDGYPVENAMDYVEVLVEGAGRLLGLDNGDSTDYDPYKGNVRKLFNGKLVAIVASKTEPGEIRVTVKGKGLESSSLILTAQETAVRSGISVNENLMEHPMELPANIPVRKVELGIPEGKVLFPGRESILVTARLYPENATDQELIWTAVNGSGIEISYVKLEEISYENGVHTARLEAHGDGEFFVRCMTKSGTDKVRLISQVAFRAEGMGQASMNPYEFITAGLYTDSIGEIGNGNEKGIATESGQASAVTFGSLDFGDYGSDEITVSIWAPDDKPYPVEIWLGKPGEEGSELLASNIYQKPSIWATYQTDTYRLPRRIKNTAAISIRMFDKVHLKGFVFTKYEKGISRIEAPEFNNIYGDSYTVGTDEITGIGNNVVIEYADMDFGREGVNAIAIWGRTPLAGNTAHINFTDEQGNSVRRILEIKGTREYEKQIISFENLCGKGKAEFIFLPGTEFDMKAFQFFHRN